MKPAKAFFICCICIGLHSGAYCQSPSDFKSKILPPSPDAASLGKYGDIPVGLYTGVPNISVPLFDAKGKELSVPISLSYHAGGIRVEETASWVGLGWSLNAGGVVTRTIRGVKDEAYNGYLNLTDTDYDELDNNSMEFIEQEVATGVRDAEPDVFFFNVGGISGKFFFDRHDVVYLDDPAFYKIIPTIAGEDITEWKIVGEDGTKYYFQQPELSKSRVLDPVMGDYEFSNSSWYLTKIVSPSGLDEISLSYSNTTINIDYSISQESGTGVVPIVGTCSTNDGQVYECPSYGPTQNRVANTIYGKRLSSISTSTYDVFFNASFPRLDMSGAYALSDITVKDKAGATLKSFLFSYGHFPSNRLKLVSVQEAGFYNSASTPVYLPPHQFAYYSSQNLPVKESFSQDAWGFYNGKINTTLIPEMMFFRQGYYQKLSGADRSPSVGHGMANVLTQITYPTGGTTAFDYEAHTYSWVADTAVAEDVTQQITVSASANAPAAVDCDVLGSTILNTTTFNIYKDQVVRVMGSIKQCAPGIASMSGRFWVTNSSNVEIMSFMLGKFDTLGTYDQYIGLTAGTYTLSARTRIANDEVGSAVQYVAPATSGPTKTYIKTAGGLRIRSITTTPGEGGLALVKQYDYSDSDSTSSGVLIGKPVFDHRQTNNKKIVCHTPWYGVDNFYSCDYLIRSSSSQMPLGTTQGSHIGYRAVSVTTTGNGKETTTFTSATTYPDIGSETFPFISKTSWDFARGKQLTHSVFDESGVLLKKSTNDYLKVTVGWVRGFKIRWLGAETGYDDYQTKRYEHLSSFLKVIQTTENNYVGSNILQTITNYAYDSLIGKLPTSVTTTNSKGQTILTKTRYPFQAAYISNLTVPESTGLSRMVTDNMITQPIEQIVKLDGAEISRTRSDFTVVPISNSAYPTVTSALKQSDSKSSSGGAALQVDESFLYYDNYANVIEYKSREGVPYSFIWSGAEGTLAAQVQNATRLDVAYSSFENATNKGNWIYTPNTYADGKTGSKSHQLNAASVSFSGLLSTKKYVVTFWAKGGVPSVSNVNSSADDASAGADGWRFFNKIITGGTSVTISGTAGIYVDELRLYPLGAMMTTYINVPGVGVTTITDSNAVSKSFQYDALIRPVLMLDNNKNITRQIQYNYKTN